MSIWQRIKLRRWIKQHALHGGIGASLYPDESPRRTVVRCACKEELTL